MSNRRKIYTVRWFNRLTHSWESARIIAKNIGGALRTASIRYGAPLDNNIRVTSKPITYQQPLPGGTYVR